MIRHAVLFAFLSASVPAVAGEESRLISETPAAGWRGVDAPFLIADQSGVAPLSLANRPLDAWMRARVVLGNRTYLNNFLNWHLAELEKRGARITFRATEQYDIRKASATYVIAGEGRARAGRIIMRPIAPHSEIVFFLYGEWRQSDDEVGRQSFETVWQSLKIRAAP
jgi:hypothetical protein